MFVDKYKPNKFTEIIARDVIIKEIQTQISKNDVGHFLFFGPAGTGKTTMAQVIANEIFGDDVRSLFYQFNASDDRGIDFVRTTIHEIAKKQPISGKFKIILMDEADYITPDAQACFRSIIPKYSAITKFIFTANYPYKLINPILSRFMKFEFPVIEVKQIATFLKKITIKENLTKTDSELIKIAKMSNGDLRQALNLLEQNAKEDESDEVWKTMTADALKKMPTNERISLAFKGEPDNIFANIWEFVKKEKAWSMICHLAECQSKMNQSVHKTLFIANFLEKIG